MAAVAAKKLVLTYVDSLRTDMLERTVAEGRAPTFGALIERGVLVPDCVSSFPSVTPVASAEMVTGRAADGHWISGMNWYHRLERRYVEYGSSLEATRAFGVFRSLYDLVYNMNLAHLNPAAETLFEQLDDAGLRTACTPFLIYRGRHRHQVSLEGLLRRAVDATRLKFRHHTWGPARALLRRPLRQPRGSLQVDLDPRQSRRLLGLLLGRAGQVRRLRLPALLAARQRQLLAPLRPGGERRVDRQGRPLLRQTRRGGRRPRRLPRPPRRDPARRSRSDSGAPRPAARRAARPRVGRAAALRVRTGSGSDRGQPDRPRGLRLPAAGGGGARRSRGAAPGPHGDRGRRPRLPARAGRRASRW